MITDTHDRLLTSLPIVVSPNATSGAVTIRFRPSAGQRLRANGSLVAVQARVPAGTGAWQTLTDSGLDLSAYAGTTLDVELRVVAGPNFGTELIAVHIR